MPIMPGAVWRGNCRNTDGRRTATTRGLVLHVNDGPNVDLWGWVNDPASDMSCHFQILQDGTIFQYLDTDWRSWCQRNGNNAWISLEMPTHPDVLMTPAQLLSGSRVMAWCAKVHNFPVVLTNDPINGRGLGWHGMGAAAGVDWGHPNCPGTIRRGQMAALVGNTTTEDDMPYKDWPQADKDALAADLTKAIITRSLAGYGYAQTVGQTLIAAASNAHTAASEAHNANVALTDPTHGLVVQFAQLPGQIEAAVDAALAKVPSGAAVDAGAIVDGVFDRLRATFDAAPQGAHA